MKIREILCTFDEHKWESFHYDSETKIHLAKLKPFKSFTLTQNTSKVLGLPKKDLSQIPMRIFPNLGISVLNVTQKDVERTSSQLRDTEGIRNVSVIEKHFELIKPWDIKPQKDILGEFDEPWYHLMVGIDRLKDEGLQGKGVRRNR